MSPTAYTLTFCVMLDSRWRLIVWWHTRGLFSQQFSSCWANKMTKHGGDSNYLLGPTWTRPTDARGQCVHCTLYVIGSGIYHQMVLLGDNWQGNKQTKGPAMTACLSDGPAFSLPAVFLLKSRKTNPSGSLIGKLKHFQIWRRIHEVIRMFFSFVSLTSRSQNSGESNLIFVV